MNILHSLSARGGRAGISYLAVLIPVLVLGVTLGGYLKLVGGQNYLSARSQAWNISLVTAENGIEEALAHLNSVSGTNLAVNGWTRVGTSQNYSKRTYVTTNYYYDVVINATNWLVPVITATGNVPTTLNFYK